MILSRRLYKLVDESPWPFLVFTASLFLTLGAVLFFHFHLNLVFSCSGIFFVKNEEEYKQYIYDTKNFDKIFRFKKELVVIEQVKDFLFLLNSKLEKLKKYNFEELSEQKVIFYDIFSKNYLIFDYVEFNTILYTTYVNDFYIKKIVLNNQLYKHISFFINLVYSKYNYPFLHESLSLFDLKSFFFKTLRDVKGENNYFDKIIILNKLNKDFKIFNTNKSEKQYDEFFFDLLDSLENNGIIISKQKNFFEFSENFKSDLYILLYRSSQIFTFGFNKMFSNIENKFYIDSSIIEEFSKEYIDFNYETKIKTDDFIFFYFLSSCTNIYSYQFLLNNTFSETLIKNEQNKH